MPKYFEMVQLFYKYVYLMQWLLNHQSLFLTFTKSLGKNIWLKREKYLSETVSVSVQCTLLTELMWAKATTAQTAGQSTALANSQTSGEC